jgi:hypothetical protein
LRPSVPSLKWCQRCLQFLAEDATVVCEFGLGCHGCARLNAACLEVYSCTLANGFD